MRRVLADTGPLYALVDPDDGLHSRAKREADLLERLRLLAVAPTPVILEGYTLVLHRLGARAAQAWCQDLLAGAALLNPTLDDYLAAAERLRRYDDQKISLTDAVVAELSARLASPVWTFDHDFDLLGVEVWRPA